MWYILDENNKPIKSTVIEAVQWIEDNLDKKAVKQETIDDNVYVSTVFLGLDHSWPKDESKPILWETMIFNGKYDQSYQERYSSYEDALEGHQKAVELVKKSK